MSVLYLVKVNSFYCLVEKLCLVCKVPYVKSNFSKKMYSNVRLAFLVCYKEKLNVSYRRFVEICDENDLQRMLCVKRIPHFSTLQKFVKRTPKKVFEKMVRACGKTLGLSGVETSIDGTGFSNTNPSHYYIKRIVEQGNKVSVKNFTKTLFLIDNETKIILNVKTFSRNVNESIYFKQMVSEITCSIKSVLADKGYDSMSNREYCWRQRIKVHIPLRKYKSQQTRMSEQIFNATPQLNSRNPGAVGATFNSKNTWASIIVDEFHSHFGAVKIAKKEKGTKLFLITDTMSPIGSEINKFKLDDLKIFHKNEQYTIKNGAIADSGLDMATAVRNCIQKTDISTDEALRMASTYPAECLGIGNILGKIKPKYTANLVIFDNLINVKAVIINGNYEKI